MILIALVGTKLNQAMPKFNSPEKLILKDSTCNFGPYEICILEVGSLAAVSGLSATGMGSINLVDKVVGLIGRATYSGFHGLYFKMAARLFP